MDLAPSPALHYCSTGSSVVFLDPDQNRYFKLPPRLEAAFRAVILFEPTSSDDCDAIDILKRRKILVSGTASSGAVSGPGVLPLRADIPTSDDVRPSLILTGRALVLRVWAASITRRQTLGELIQVIETAARLRTVPPEQNHASVLHRISAAVRRVDRIISPREQCLPRSLCLHMLCRWAGIDTCMVLGVRDDPFQAHCWVQSGGVAVSGDFEQASLFTPILVIA